MGTYIVHHPDFGWQAFGGSVVATSPTVRVRTLDSVRRLIADGRLDSYLAKRYPQRHEVQSDSALLDYVSGLKREYLRNAPPLHRVRYENGMDAIRNALGLHVRSSRVQGAKLKSKQEIRIASVFR